MCSNVHSDPVNLIDHKVRPIASSAPHRIGRDLDWWWLMDGSRCVVACRVGWMPLLAGRAGEFRSGIHSEFGGWHVQRLSAGSGGWCGVRFR
jgi:hypothetical protein